VLDLFKGRPQNRGACEISFSEQIGDLALKQEELETNLDVVRRRNNIFMKESICSKDWIADDGFISIYDYILYDSGVVRTVALCI